MVHEGGFDARLMLTWWFLQMMVVKKKDQIRTKWHFLKTKWRVLYGNVIHERPTHLYFRRTVWKKFNCSSVSRRFWSLSLRWSGITTSTFTCHLKCGSVRADAACTDDMLLRRVGCLIDDLWTQEETRCILAVPGCHLFNRNQHVWPSCLWIGSSVLSQSLVLLHQTSKLLYQLLSAWVLGVIWVLLLNVLHN